MQTRLNKISTFFERILQVSESQGYKNITEFSKNALKYKSPQKIMRLKDSKNSPSVDIILDISNKFEIVNLDWLLTGKGDMLKESKQSNRLAEAAGVYRTKGDKDVAIQKIPLYSLEASAGIVNLFRDQQPTKEFISIPNLPKCDGALYINGDSMYPLLKSGDIVMYKQIQEVSNCIFVWGEMYLISFQADGDDYSTVKFIQKSDQGIDFIKLVSQNEHHQPIDIPKNTISALALVKASIRINSMM